MFKLKLLNAALAVALGLGFGIASAQTDQATQHGNALDKPSNKADQQAVGIPAKPGAQSGQTAQRPNEQIAQRDENKTTGQGQGVRESGGQAESKHPRKAVIPRLTTSPNRAAHRTAVVKVQEAAPEAMTSAR
jgi:uncharacterized protein HemX